MDEDSYIKLCRLCLRKPEEEVSWLTDQKVKDELLEALSDIKLEETKKLSQIICQSCMNLIQTIRDFKQTIKRNQSFLWTLLQKPDLGQFVEVNVIEPEVKKEEPVNESSNKPVPRSNSPEDEELLSDQDDFNYVPSEKESSSDDEISEKEHLSEDDYAIPDKDSEFKSDKLPLPPLKFEKRTKFVWCPFCYLKFKHKYLLSGHGKLRHPEYNWAFRKPKSTRTSWACKFCDKVYGRRFFLKEHAMVAHFGREPYQCDLCDFKSQLKSGIRDHIESKHLGTWKIYRVRKKKSIPCVICNHVYQTTESYNHHMRKFHQESEDRPFKCAKCISYFRSQKSLDQHNRNKHIIEDRPFTCSLCISARFVSEDILNLHKKRHEIADTRRETQPFACSACELRFCKKSLLDSHTKHHQKNELNSCQVCGMTLHRSSMGDHLDTHETKYEDYKHVCSLCGKRFRVEWSLLKHEKAHEAPEFFECDKCGKTMKKKSNFTSHIRKCQGPHFICKFCGQKFSTKGYRDSHQRIVHTGWSCKRCNMQFNRGQDLKIHLKTLEHKIKGICGKLETDEIKFEKLSK